MTENQKVARTHKKSTPEIRQSMLEKGCLFFRFDQPHHDETMNGYFKSMEEQGFLVTTSGCIFAYENFNSGSKGRPKGHKISTTFFHGSAPQFPEHQYGWPVKPQASHLCHRKKCINPTHLIWEEQWKNLKRNYCGDTGSCDCGNATKCIRIYHNEDWVFNDTFITYDTVGFKQAVSKILPNIRYTILHKNYYSAEDKKKISRNMQKKKRKASQSQDEPVKKKNK